MSTGLYTTLQRDDDDIVARFGNLTRESDVADLLEVPRLYFRHLIANERSQYRTFELPKKSGGSRQIAAPPKPLRILQAKLNYVLQLVYTPKACVNGFRRHRSTLSNAQAHIGRRWVLNIDLTDFFPSIHFGRVRGAFAASPFGLPEAAATALAQLCTTIDGKLPQGAPTSPFVSNIVAARLDGQMMALAKRLALKYSRYADDLTLSSDRRELPLAIAMANGGWTGPSVIIGAALESVVTSNGFSINAAKTRLQRRDCHQEVTGIVVNRLANVPWAYVRQLQILLHQWRRFGVNNTAVRYCEAQSIGDCDESDAVRHFRAALKGKIQFVGQVRGRTDPVYCRLRARLHALDGQLIAAPPQAGQFAVGVATPSDDRFSDIVRRRVRSVVALEVKTDRRTSLGTAFAVSERVLVTAGHNMKGNVSAVLAGVRLALDDVLTSTVESVDAAVVRLNHGIAPLDVDSRLPVIGEGVAVLGFPSIPSQHPSMSPMFGRIETVAPVYDGSVELLTLSIPSVGGLSGAPVLDGRGRAIGMIIESVFEESADGVPGREFIRALPIGYVLKLIRAAAN